MENVYFVLSISKSCVDSQCVLGLSERLQQQDSSKIDDVDTADLKLAKYGIVITRDVNKILPAALLDAWCTCLHRFKLFAPIEHASGGSEEYSVETLAQLLDPAGIPALKPTPPPPSRPAGTMVSTALMRKYSANMTIS